MDDQKICGEGLTFEDLLLIPAKSSVLPSDVSLKAQFSRNIFLNVPLVSAAMDTVSEAQLCIALAREGGLGVIHKNMSIAEQVEEVDRVKRSESGVITKPYTLSSDAKLSDAHHLMQSRGVSGFPVVDDGQLVGIVTNRDLRFQRDLSQPIRNVMTPRERLITAPLGTDLETTESLLQQHRIEKLLLVDEHGKLMALVTAKDIHKRLQFPNACKDSSGKLRVGAAVGVGSESILRASALVEAGVDVLVVDSAHGHSENVIAAVRNLRKEFPSMELVAGNVVTRDAALELVDAGVDAVKVGVGPGSICTTRIVAGVGVPQMTAIFEIAAALEGTGVPFIADGGIRYSGDIAKAIAGGAHTVMIGSMFAGTEESPGETILLEGRSYKQFRGMGSIGAMAKGSADRYFQDAAAHSTGKYVPEGIEGRVPYKGRLSDTVFQLMGGLRSAMGYCGAANLEELQKKSRLIKMTSAGYRESHPHDVIVTREAPNYELPHWR